MKWLTLLLVFIMCLCACAPCVGALAYADTFATKYDDTYVLNDLKGATINGKTFDTADYPQSDGGEPRLLEFAEWEFSTKYEYQYNYGLYFYFYNPSGRQIQQHQLNKIQLADTYNADGKPSSYKKYALLICSESVDKLFYKFKLTDVADVYARVVGSTERRYDISGIEVLYNGATNATEYEIGGKWTYTGYAKGMSAESADKSTLTSKSEKLQTIVLDDLKFTYYRTWHQVVGWTADQLTSVYFSVDKTLADSYDDLYSIQAECWKYLTSPIFCLYDKYILGVNSSLVSYSELYSNLLKQKGADQNREGIWLGWDTVDFSGGGVENYLYAYNRKPLSSELGGEINVLSWLFQISKKEDWTVNSDRLLTYMKEYSALYGKEVQGKYSKDLFANEYYYTALSSNEVKTGYLPIDISCDDNFTLVGSSRKANFWDYLTFGATFDTSESEPMSPIIAIDYSTIAKLSDNEISTKYLVAEKDVPEFKQSVKDASGKGKVTYLFRFDTSTYLNVPFGYQSYGTVGYLAQEMAYLDFDIISLGYRKNNVVTKIPVVNSPIDILATVEPGQDVVDVLGNLKNNGLKIVPLIIGAVLVVVIVKLVVDLFDNSGKRRKRK